MGLLEDFGFSEDDNSSYEPEVQEDNGIVIPAPEGAPTDISALRRGGSNDELRAAIIATSQKLGIDPVHLATAISYETAGTFDPWKAGPTTQWGQHRGLIQWGVPQAKQYGVGPDTSITDQLNAVGRYLADRGVKPGMGLLDVYSAINAGRVGLYDRSDANNGGAPGTVRDKVEKQMGGHRQKAAALLGGMNAIAYTPEPTPEFPDYAPRSGPRRTGAAPGTGYIRLDNGRWGPAPEGVPPQAMFYGKTPKVSTGRTPDYIRSGVPGLQKGYVPPEMRGPFRVNLGTDYNTAVGTVAPPVTGSVDLHWNKLPASVDMPGMPIDDATPLDPKLVEQLQALTVPTEPVAPVLDESAGLNLAKTAPNISFASTTPEAPLPAPVLNLPPKDQDSLLVTKGDVHAPGTPSVPISTDNLDTSSFSYLDQEAGPAPEKPPMSFMDMVDAAVRVGKDTVNTVKQGAAAVAGNMTGLPFEAAAMLRSVLPTTSGIDRVQSAGNLIAQGQKMREGSDFQFGVNKVGQTPAEKGGRFVGQNLTPAGAQTGLATGLMMVADFASDAISAAQAAEKAKMLPKDVAEQLLMPSVGNDNKWGPRVTHTVQTAAGPLKFDDANFRMLGYGAAATVGFMAIPWLARKIATTPFFQVKPRTDAHGITRYSGRRDALETYTHDQFAGLNNIMQRVGVNEQARREISASFAFETGSAVRNLSTMAVEDGKMVAKNFSFDSSVPVRKLQQVESPEATQYLHLYNNLDAVREKQRVLMTKSQQHILSVGQPTVDGMTQYQIGQAIRQMENSPSGQHLKDIRIGYRENQLKLYHFEYTGEYGMHTKKEYNDLRKNHANAIHQKDLGDDLQAVTKLRASDTMAEHMPERMRLRMENEAKGKFIDENVRVDPTFARKITAEELAHNPSYANKVVTFKRRGVTEHWLTDPFVAMSLKFDPYTVNHPIMKYGIQKPKQLVEATTTGKYAPWFAPISMWRNHHLIRLSAPEGFASPNGLQTVAAIPQQLYPQIAKNISSTLDDMSNGWLGTVMPQGSLQAMSLKAAQVYDNHIYTTLKHRGASHMSQYDPNYNLSAATAMGKAAQHVKGPTATVFNGIKALLEATHNAGNYAFAAKNIRAGKNATDVARVAREITGNPHKSGAFQTGAGRIRFVDENENVLGKIGTKTTEIIGGAFEAGRVAGPWFNITTQGMARLGKAWKDDPIKFAARMARYEVLPAAAIYMFTRGAGEDPNGVSYVDYMMNRRSPYKTMMYTYIPIPGLPAERGIEIPLPHEASVFRALTHGMLHHANASEEFGVADDYMKAAAALVGVNYKPSIHVPLNSAEKDFMKTIYESGKIMLVPSAPPVLNAVLGMQGISTFNGPFVEGFKKRESAFDSNPGMNTALEGFVRNIAPGVGAIVGAGYAAYAIGEDGVAGNVQSALKAMGGTAIEKTPFIRDIIGWRPPVAGSTAAVDELYEDKKILEKLENYSKTLDPTRGEKKDPNSIEGERAASIFMRDHAGREIVSPPKSDNWGRPQVAPINPLYNAFMSELHDKLKKDAISDRGYGKVPSGGIGMPSHWERYTEFTDAIRKLRKVEYSNVTTWKARMEADPKIVEYLKSQNIPIDNPRQVRNALEHGRQSAARQIMYTYRALEQDFQTRLGDPNFKFEDLDPHSPYILPQGFTPQPYAPQYPAWKDQIELTSRPSRAKKPLQ